MIGIDTSALIDFFKGNKSLKNLIDELDGILVLNQISYLELVFGLDFNKPNDKKEEKFYDDLYNSLLNFELDILASKKAAQINNNLIKVGKIIEPFDCAIAGIYLANGVDKIITKNTKHFDKIKGLKVLSY